MGLLLKSRGHRERVIYYIDKAVPFSMQYYIYKRIALRAFRPSGAAKLGVAVYLSISRLCPLYFPLGAKGPTTILEEQEE